MTAKRTYLLLIAATLLLFVGLILGTYETNAFLSARAAKLSNLRAKSMALTMEQTDLLSSKRALQKDSQLADFANKVVAPSKNQTAIISELTGLASSNNIQLSSITFPASTLGTTTTAAAGSTSPAVPTNTSAATNLKSITTTQSQLQTIKTIPGVSVLAIALQSDVTKPVQYTDFINFLNAIETGEIAQVTNVQIQPSTTTKSSLSFSLNLDEFVQ